MHLYEINAEIERVLEGSIDPETGEVLIPLVELDELQIDRVTKILDTAAYIKGIQAEAEAIKAEEKILAHRRKALENRETWLREYLRQNLEEGERMNNSRISITWRKSSAVEILDDTAIPEEYWSVKRDISTTLIADAIKTGVDVPGATYVQRQNLVIK